MLFAIAVPNRDDFKAEMVGSLFTLGIQAIAQPGWGATVFLPQGAYVDRNRNLAIATAKQMEVDWLLWLDSDVTVLTRDRNVIEYLTGLGKDLVSGIYVDRSFPHRPHIYKFVDSGVQSIPDIPEELFRADAVGAGFLLMSKKVIDAFTPEIIDKYGEPFNYLNYGRSTALYEDVAFCWRAKQLGFELWVDPAIKLAHIGKMSYTVEHWEYTKTHLASTNNIPGWMSEDECKFLRQVAPQMKSVVEIGSWKGRSTKEFLDAGAQVTAVDHWSGSPTDDTHQLAQEEDVFEQFMSNVGHYSNLKVMRMFSLEAAPQFEDKSVDMVFIDASHDYENVKADIAAWRGKAKKIVAGHDYAMSWPGVMRAVNEAFPEGVKTHGSIWYAEAA